MPVHYQAMKWKCQLREQPLPLSRGRRRIESTGAWSNHASAAQDPFKPLEDALQLVHLYFERGSPKAEPAARRWLVRYLSEGTPTLRDVARVTASLYSAHSRRVK